MTLFTSAGLRDGDGVVLSISSEHCESIKIRLLTEGIRKDTSAATWLITTARNKFAEDQDEGGVENVTRLLDRLKAQH